jgi:hypothetical protein
MERLFASIPAVLKGLGPNAKTDEALIFAAWRSAAGKPLNERTAAVEFFDNRLVVAVTDETWRRHLEDLSPQLLARINSGFDAGTVRFIEFVIDLKAVNAEKSSSQGSENREGSSVDPSLAKAADVIKNDDLREQFLSTAATYLDRQDRT